MKLTKANFKTAMHTIFSISFLCAFGVGHLIANDTPDYDELRPVITVPVIYRANNDLYPDDVDFLNNSLVINYRYDIEDDDNGLLFKNLYTFYIAADGKNNLFVDINFSVYSGNILIAEQTFNHLCGSLMQVRQVPYIFYNNDLYVDDQGDYAIYGEYDFSIGQNQVTSYYKSFGDVVSINRSDALDPNTHDSWSNVGQIDVNFMLSVLSSAESENIYNRGYVDGINYVLNHLDEYDLYTLTQYLQYGQSEYQRGYNAHDVSNVLSVSDMIREIFRSPISMFKNAFNFVLPLPDGTSLNVGGILTFFLTIGIALTIVQLISKIGGK